MQDDRQEQPTIQSPDLQSELDHTETQGQEQQTRADAAPDDLLKQPWVEGIFLISNRQEVYRQDETAARSGAGSSSSTPGRDDDTIEGEYHEM